LSCHITSNSIFSFLQASSIIGYSLLTVSLEFKTLPISLFYPTMIQPSVSSAVLPEWINTPSNELTFNNLGVYLPNLGE